jgi:intergrase/recombinase
MRTINIVLSSSDEKTLDKKIENYKTCYPPLGYDTRVRSIKSSDGLLHAHIERNESCD